MLKIKQLPNNIIKKIEAETCAMWNTQAPYTYKFSDYQMTEKSNLWGILIKYPPNENRDYHLIVFVDFKENEIKKLIEKENIKIENIKDFTEVYNRVLIAFGLDPEIEKFYRNYCRRQNFKEGLQNAKY